MKVSIVLPNYNYAHYLDERITSLLGQTMPDFELIILDDASTDDSRRVIERYAAADPRVRFLWFDTNSGSAYVRQNYGATCASGEYLLFANADDSCEPTLLEKLAATLDAHPTVVIAYAQSMEIDEASQPIGLVSRWTVELDPHRWDEDFVAPGIEEAGYLMRQNTIPNSSAALLRRSTYERVGPFDASLPLCADWMLWVRMMACGDVAYVAEPLNRFRMHTRSVRTASGRSGSFMKEFYQVAEEVAGAFRLAPAVRERACEHLARTWVNWMFAVRGAGILSRAPEVHRIARRVDPELYRHLAAALGAGLLSGFTRRVLRRQ